MENVSLHFITERVVNRPLLVHPEKAEQIFSVLGQRMGFGQQDLFVPQSEVAIERMVPETSGFAARRKSRADGSGTTLFREANGVGVVRVTGSLVNRGAWLDANSGLTSYEGILAQIKEAAADSSVNSILLDIESFGGEAAGMFSLAQAIREARKEKPVTAVVNDVAASAAYGIASAANEIVISPTSAVGSIGVVLMHLDRSKQYADAGVKPTLIFAGAHKVDGNPFEPLSAAVREDLQKLVQQHYSSFVETVWKGRGEKLPAEAARGTEARMFIGKDAVSAGLADRIGTFDSTLAEMQSRPGSPRSKTGGNSKMFTQAEMDAAAATAKAEGKTEGHAAGKTEGVTEGTAAERTRATAILALEEAGGRATLAASLVKTGSTVEAAKDLLAASPKSDANGLPPRTLGGNGPDLAAPTAAPTPDAAQAGWDKAAKAYNARK